MQAPTQCHKDHDYHGNMTRPKETNKTLMIDPEEMDIYVLSEELRIIPLRKCNKLLSFNLLYLLMVDRDLDRFYHAGSAKLA